MASPRTRAVLSKARKRDDNNNCFECGAPNTQWITVHYGTWLCLECAGKHRGLGVHLSFVRSVTMDKWKDIEIEKVKVSGNRQCLEFLSSQPDYRADWSFSEKWNSRAAAFYRDKVNSLALGKPWSPETSPARNWIPGISGFIKNSQSFAAANSSLEEDFGVSQKDIVFQKDDYFGEHDPGMSQRDSYHGYGYAPHKGKFSGFGSVPPKKEHQKPEFLESAISSLSVGWSALSRTAAHAASFAKDSQRTFEHMFSLGDQFAGKPNQSSSGTDAAYQLGQQATTRASVLAEQVKEGSLLNEVQSTVSTAASKAADLGWRGWQHVQSVFGDRRSSDYVSVNSTASDKTDLIQPSYVADSGCHNQAIMQPTENDDWSSFGQEEANDKETSVSATTTCFGSASVVAAISTTARKPSAAAAAAAAATTAGSKATATAVNIPKVPMPSRVSQNRKKKSDSDLIDFSANDKKPPGSDWDAQAWDILNP